MGAIAVARLPGLLREVPFGPWWWSYGMPSAALALALLVWEGDLGEVDLLAGVVGVACATLAALTLIWATVRAARRAAIISTHGG